MGLSKDKLVSLNKYASGLRDKLAAPVPAKHSHAPEQFKVFLNNELKTVEAVLNAEKDAAMVGGAAPIPYAGAKK